MSFWRISLAYHQSICCLFHTRSTILELHPLYSRVWTWVLVPGHISLDTLHRRLKASSYIFLFISLFYFSLLYGAGRSIWQSAITVELNIFPQYGLVHRCQKNWRKLSNNKRNNLDTVTMRRCRSSIAYYSHDGLFQTVRQFRTTIGPHPCKSHSPQLSPSRWRRVKQRFDARQSGLEHLLFTSKLFSPPRHAHYVGVDGHPRTPNGHDDVAV